jgi:selenide,water dikinase
LHVPNDPRVLIDFRTSDDAGVYKFDGNRALVQTVDFFTPIVDDPFVYGQIAAANALSDVYAMGGRPLTALAIAGFPKDADREILGTIFKGGLEMLGRARVALLGGHTVQDSEIKFGYAITGEIDVSSIWSNAGARAGDVLILTKPIGTGVVSTAIKFARAPQPAIDAAMRSMTTLNRAASDALRSAGAGAVHACTDITGFGLIGHASEMAIASGCTIEIDSSTVPFLPGARELAAGKENVPGGGRTNAQHFGGATAIAPDVEADVATLLFDPQTSGGLLAAVDPVAADRALQALVAEGVQAISIGRVVPRANVAIVVR